MTQTLYERLVSAGCEIDNHETDLYVKHTPQALEIIKAYETEGNISNRESFRSAIDGTLWYDLPFHYNRLSVKGS